MTDIMAWCNGLMAGLIAGIIYALIGYFRLKDENEPFNGQKFMRAILIGAIVGIIAFLYGIPLDSAQNTTTSLITMFGASFAIDQLAAELWARIKGWLKK
jgi:uncharacterized membrane protein